MYNRYIPQPDGSYRKRKMPEANRPGTPVHHKAPTPPKQEHCPSEPHPLPPPKPNCPQRPQESPAGSDGSILSFFRHLLPRGLDTADLMIILLLLLMAGDREEDRNNALLTLALYFFM